MSRETDFDSGLTPHNPGVGDPGVFGPRDHDYGRSGLSRRTKQVILAALIAGTIVLLAVVVLVETSG